MSYPTDRIAGRLATVIQQQTQPTPVSCTHTCIAMALGRPVQSLGLDINRPFHPLTLGYWLAVEWGIWMRRCDRSEPVMRRAVYVVGIRSQNKVGVDHSVLLDTRQVDPLDDPAMNGDWWDPNKGRGDDVVWVGQVSPCSILDMVELIDFHKRGDPTAEQPQEE